MYLSPAYDKWPYTGERVIERDGDAVVSPAPTLMEDQKVRAVAGMPRLVVGDGNVMLWMVMCQAEPLPIYGTIVRQAHAQSSTTSSNHQRFLPYRKKRTDPLQTISKQIFRIV